MKDPNQELAKKLLKNHRKKIDMLDRQILKLLGARFDVVRQVAEIKIKNDISGFLHDRVVEVRENAVQGGKKYGIDPAFMRALYTMLIYESCATEDVIKAKHHRKKNRR